MNSQKRMICAKRNERCYFLFCFSSCNFILFIYLNKKRNMSDNLLHEHTDENSMINKQKVVMRKKTYALSDELILKLLNIMSLGKLSSRKNSSAAGLPTVERRDVKMVH